MKRKCPCCGKLNILNYKSQVYRDVFICSNCVRDEFTSKWYVTNRKPSSDTTNYLNLRNDYINAMMGRDELKLGRVKTEVLMVESNRICRYIVVQKKNYNQMALADFGDSNEALAYANACCSSTYKRLTDNLWLGADGDCVEIEYM